MIGLVFSTLKSFLEALHSLSVLSANMLGIRPWQKRENLGRGQREMVEIEGQSLVNACVLAKLA